MTNPVRELVNLGQSAWLDDLRREYLQGGRLAGLISEYGVGGVTSNPSIFERAIDSSSVYDDDIAALAREGATAEQIYEALAIADVRSAADLLRETFERAAARDGYVSLEVSPHLAYDTAATVADAIRLWGRVQRQNAFIKVPGTEAGLPAIRALTARGINVNVTLLFGVARYLHVVDAYLSGLEDRLGEGADVDGVSSVASFFVSRIDTEVDHRLDACVEAVRPGLRGSAAIASAKLAYAEFLKIQSSSRWQRLEASGARIQRLLWASTGTKDPAYSDIKYVEALIAPGTIVTLPPATLEAYRDHGRAAVRIEDELDLAVAVPGELEAHGVYLESVARDLEAEGVRKFADSFNQLLARLERARAELSKPSLVRQTR